MVKIFTSVGIFGGFFALLNVWRLQKESIGKESFNGLDLNKSVVSAQRCYPRQTNHY